MLNMFQIKKNTVGTIIPFKIKKFIKMKIKYTFLIIISCIVCMNSPCFSQSGNTVLTPDNISIDKIKSMFESAYISITNTEDKSITIKDTYTIYVDLSSNKKYITYSTYWPINEGFSIQDKLDLLNTISKDIVVISAYYGSTGKTITIKTTIWLEGGNTEKNIIMTEKIFVKALDLVLTKDTKRIIK